MIIEKLFIWAPQLLCVVYRSVFVNPVLSLIEKNMSTPFSVFIFNKVGLSRFVGFTEKLGKISVQSLQFARKNQSLKRGYFALCQLHEFPQNHLQRQKEIAIFYPLSFNFEQMVSPWVYRYIATASLCYLVLDVFVRNHFICYRLWVLLETFKQDISVSQFSIPYLLVSFLYYAGLTLVPELEKYVLQEQGLPFWYEKIDTHFSSYDFIFYLRNCIRENRTSFICDTKFQKIIDFVQCSDLLVIS